MAFAWYKKTSKQDLDALVAYLRTLKPARPDQRAFLPAR
jgi:hypothetical protein